MELREVTMDDLPLWEQMQCDPAMMAELGGPHPKADMPGILRRSLDIVESGQGWMFKVMADEDSELAIGSVSLWEHTWQGQNINEIGWMILPPYQGKGFASSAVRALLDKARSEGRWQVIHAFPAVSNLPSNGICRKMGFSLVEACEYDYAGRILRCNHWQIDLREIG